MRIVTILILSITCSVVHAQSWFAKNFKIESVELKFGQGGITNQTWQDGMHGASALSYLEVANDNAGIKQDRLTSERPFDVAYSYSDYSGYCCGNTSNVISSRSQIGIKLKSKKYWRLRTGINLTIQNKSFGGHDYYPLDDTPYGDQTLYLEEVGVLDEVRLTKYSQTQFDTTLYVPRTLLAYLDNPSTFIGIGVSVQFVLHENVSKRNHFYVNVSGNLLTALNNTTTLEMQYYNYSRISGGEYGDGHVNGFQTNQNDYYSVNVAGRTSNKEFVIEYKTPAINGSQMRYGLEYTRQLFKSFPLTFSLGVGVGFNTYWRNWKTVFNTEEVFYATGLGLAIK
ncbi:MAG: hypothetical protein ACI9JN_000817 [Bacteroidia bacterium]|jgi:hypothetical protein